MTRDHYSAMKERRSIYSLSKASDISDDRIKEVIEFSILHTPTAFNSQSGRVVLLLDAEHDKLWNMTKEALRAVVPAERFQPTNDKIESFKAGYGTVLFFEDTEVVESLQEKFPSYRDNFPLWSYQASGMLQYNVWTSLSAEGLGVSLQHYNELIEKGVRDEWKLPVKWKMISQMPFGKPTAEAAPKEFMDLAVRFKVFSSK